MSRIYVIWMRTRAPHSRGWDYIYYDLTARRACIVDLSQYRNTFGMDIEVTSAWKPYIGIIYGIAA